MRAGRRRMLKLAGVAAALAMTTACVREDAPRMHMNSVSANIAFSEAPSVKAAAPAGFATPSPADVATSSLPDLPPQLGDIAPPAKFSPPLPPSPAKPCPVASTSSYPKQPAASNVPTPVLPTAGVYAWRHAGTYVSADAFGATLPLIGTSDRSVQNVVRASDTTFSFDVVEKDVFTKEIVTTTWAVNTAGTTPTSRVPIAPPGAPTPPSAGEPGRGLAIQKIERRNPATHAINSTFAPPLPLLILPLPVKVSDHFTSAAVDPTTAAVLQYDATVDGIARVDACGEIIEGFKVSGTENFADGATTSSRSYSVVVAPQLGALPIQETFDQSVGTIAKMTFTVNQLEPRAP
jgi:hypothetical protein